MVDATPQSGRRRRHRETVPTPHKLGGVRRVCAPAVRVLASRGVLLRFCCFPHPPWAFLFEPLVPPRGVLCRGSRHGRLFGRPLASFGGAHPWLSSAPPPSLACHAESMGVRFFSRLPFPVVCTCMRRSQSELCEAEPGPDAWATFFGLRAWSPRPPCRHHEDPVGRVHQARS